MLCVEAVVNPTNESLTDKNAVSTRLLEMAGPELKDECKTQIGSECETQRLLIHLAMSGSTSELVNSCIVCLVTTFNSLVVPRALYHPFHCVTLFTVGALPTLVVTHESVLPAGCRTGEARITGAYNLPARSGFTSAPAPQGFYQLAELDNYRCSEACLLISKSLVLHRLNTDQGVPWCLRELSTHSPDSAMIGIPPPPQACDTHGRSSVQPAVQDGS